MKQLVANLTINALFAALCGAAIGLIAWSLEAGILLGFCLWLCTFHPRWMRWDTSSNEKPEILEGGKRLGPVGAIVIILLAVGFGGLLVPLFLRLGFPSRLSFRLPFLGSFLVIAWVFLRLRGNLPTNKTRSE